MSSRRTAGTTFLLGAVALLSIGFGGVTADAGGQKRVLIRAARPYASLEAQVRRLGGVVTHRYQNVDAFAATIPEDQYQALVDLAGADKVSKDMLVEAPQPVDRAARGSQVARPSLQADGADRVATSPGGALPADYLFNDTLIGATAAFAEGNFGQDVVVAVIDTGVANSPVVPALYLGSQVLGGENFVSSDAVTSATSRLNGAHGTWVGTVIAGNVVFQFANSGAFVQTLQRYAPGAIAGACPPAPPTVACQVPMLGVAPMSKLYALKVFPSTGGGTAESVIIAAMDRAITLKRSFDAGGSTAPVAGDGSEDNPFVYDALNIQVVNMSLGGSTGFAGRDLEDALTAAMIKAGITIVTSAGNDGFAAMTESSPGSGFGSLTVAAASEPAHERIVADLFLCGTGCGALYRPSDFVQTADFSSRGPTADGRLDPDLSANGVWTWAQGTCEGAPATCAAGTTLAPLSFVSGTSFSSPTVAGAAALLRKAFPLAGAAQIRNALIAGANPRLIEDGSRRIDQGRGFLDVPTALAKLQGGRVSNRIDRSFPTDWVKLNIFPLGFRPVFFRGDTFATHVNELKPGQVTQFFVDVDPGIDQLVVKLTNVTPELPPDQQNQIFQVDDMLIRVADAPTSFWSSPCVLPPSTACEAFVAAEQTITIDNPQTGLVRVALQGDWTNAGKVSADLSIERKRGRPGVPTAFGRVRQSDMIPIEVEIPAGTAQAVFELSWEGNWARYPSNDLDLILLDPGYPNTPPILTGATLASPERAVIDDPTPGVWTAFIQGFTVRKLKHERGDFDEFALRVTADGKRLRPVPAP